jgi:hypothetical protein
MSFFLAVVGVFLLYQLRRMGSARMPVGYDDELLVGTEYPIIITDIHDDDDCYRNHTKSKKQSWTLEEELPLMMRLGEEIKAEMAHLCGSDKNEKSS